MGSLDSVVTVSISKQTASPTRAGFGVPLILSGEAKARFGTEATRIYTDVAGLVADGFSATGVTVAMATALLSQRNQPQTFVVGKRNLLPTQVIQITVASVLNSHTYRLTINGVTFSYAADSSTSVQEIVEGLAAAVNAGTEPVTATEDNTTLTLTADVAGTLFTLEIEDRSILTRFDATPDPGIATDLTNIRTGVGRNDSWYLALLDSQSKAEISALAAALEALPKAGVFAGGDDAVYSSGTTDIAAVLAAANYDRSAFIFSPTPGERPDCAWAGACLPLDPGSETWKFKTLVGCTAYDLTPTERANVVGKSANVYETIAGLDITSEGTMASGEFIDVTRFLDSLEADIKESVFAKMANLDKIPFTDSGIAVAVAEVRGALLRGVRRGGLSNDPFPTVTAPKASEVSDANKAARTLPDIRFFGVLAGAVHKAEVQGTVSL